METSLEKRLQSFSLTDSKCHRRGHTSKRRFNSASRHETPPLRCKVGGSEWRRRVVTRGGEGVPEVTAMDTTFTDGRSCDWRAGKLSSAPQMVGQDTPTDPLCSRRGGYGVGVMGGPVAPPSSHYYSFSFRMKFSVCVPFHIFSYHFL